MSAEGAIAITAALLAGSVALLGFGLDSAIEGLASIILIWRFTGSRRLSERAEQRAQRLVAITFFLLAPYITQDAIRTLEQAASTPPPAGSGSPCQSQASSRCHYSATPNSASGSACAQAQPPAKARRTSSAPTSPPACSLASCSTPRSACGGPTPPSRSPSPRSPSTKATKPGKATAAAPGATNPRRAAQRLSRRLLHLIACPRPPRATNHRAATRAPHSSACLVRHR